jgi:amino acid adenylation domain-containing protein
MALSLELTSEPVPEGMGPLVDQMKSTMKRSTAVDGVLLKELDDIRQSSAIEDAPVCVHSLFERQAARSPDSIALLSRGASLTYCDLNQQANQLAHYLRQYGVGPESLVGVCLERSFEMVISMLAILKAGGAYLPLDPVYPRERLRFMLEDAKLKLLLTEQRLLDCVPASDAKIICLDTEAGSVAANSKQNPVNLVNETNLAYVIYTSGSTGKPKGVMVTHRGVPNLAQAQAEAFAVHAQSRVLQFASMSFDASVSEVFKTLLVGAQLYLEPQNYLNGPDLSRVLRENQITVVTLPPSALGTLRQEKLPALRTLVVAGEVCPPRLAARWSPGRRFLNAYGPTEITVCATIAECDGASRTLSIGRPMLNTEVYVLDSNLQLMAAGEVGELYLTGVGIARGYHNRPDLTAEKFIPNCFSAEPGSRLYRTGDLGYYLPDGQIEFLGRNDNQVKMRGFRVELGEIEATLSRHAGVSACAAIVREDTPGEQKLVAYIVGESLETPDSAELKSYLRQQLPEYMVPMFFVPLKSLPLSPNGKIDRGALPAPSVTRQSTPKTGELPQTILERLLARLWCEVLSIETVNIQDNFFEVGGDSLKSARFLNRLQEELGEVVYVVALFDAPTLAGLAAYLQQHYPQAVARLSGEDCTEGDFRGGEKIDERTLTYVRQLIPSLPRFDSRLKRRNPPAIFVLSPPRSGSTLLRVMLAGHEELFAPPELQLLCCNTLQDRRSTFTGRYGFWLEGTIRALMEIKSCDAETARQLMAECEEQDMTAPEFYLLMQDLIAPRKLVDKTPAYALDLEVLKRSVNYFEDVHYIHLLRHPYGMIRSFEDAKLDQIFRFEHRLSSRQLAESIWTICHQNIAEFLKHVPAHRQHVVKFEELIKQPATIIDELCRFLGIPFDEVMIEPHTQPEKKMTDGIHGLSRMLGDIKFHTHKTVDASIADRWRENHQEDFLSDVTWNLATSFGYERPSDSHTARAARTHSPIKGLPRNKRMS